MNFKDFNKRLNRLLARQALFLSSSIIRFLPRQWLYAFANFIAILAYYIAVKQRKIALESLHLAFGEELGIKERIKIAKNCFKNMAKSGVEMFYLLDNPENCKQLVEIEGKEYLDKALLKGNGVIAVSAHFGNFPLALSRLSQEGYKVSVILRRMRDEKVEDFLGDRRKKMGIHSIHSAPRQACVDNSLKSLRNNEILFIQLDQNFGTAGVFVDFFQRKAATATGPVVFALRTNACILPLFIVRKNDDTHKIIIGEEIEIQKKDTQEEILQYNIQKITKIIEYYIRKYPQEWGWIHRRWKSRPAPVADKE